MILSTSIGYLSNIIKLVWSIILGQIRLCNKWFLHKTTNLCELQRIVYGTLNGYERIHQIENSLQLSKNVRIQEVLLKFYQIVEIEARNDAEDAGGTIEFYDKRENIIKQVTKVVVEEKKIKVKLHTKFVIGMETSLLSIYAVCLLRLMAENRRKIAFQVGDENDEAKLQYIWDVLMDEKLVGKESKQWGDMGFQHVHPSTDFRGAGMLAVDSLMYLVNRYKDNSKQLLSLSLHPKYGYPFGLLSIHITFLANQLLQMDLSKTHFYNMYENYKSWNVKENEAEEQESNNESEMSNNSSSNLRKNIIKDKLMLVYYEFYVALLFKFIHYWFEMKPESIMQYGTIKAKFEDIVRNELLNSNVRISPLLKNI